MERVRLGDILGPDNIAVGVAETDRLAVLKRLIGLLPVEGVGVHEQILASVLKREEIQTTGIGYGIAIPHGRADIGPPLVASIGLTANPVDYDSVDGTPARIFILMVSRRDVTGPHVQALAHVARLLGHRKFREDLLACAEPRQVLTLIRGEETA